MLLIGIRPRPEVYRLCRFRAHPATTELALRIGRSHRVSTMQSGSPLCQAGADARRSSGVASVAAGPGSDLSEVLINGDLSAALDFVVAPECPSGPAACPFA